jgi:3-isopropylmalate/(R)-2-methylmalate dehydratase small subunit
LDPQAHLLTVDLASQIIRIDESRRMPFSIPAEVKQSLLDGVDAIDQTQKLHARIEEFRAADRLRRPWVYESVER